MRRVLPYISAVVLARRCLREVTQERSIKVTSGWNRIENTTEREESSSDVEEEMSKGVRLGER